jgi:hypothetical protein
MSSRYLTVTYRKGKPLTAYLCLPRCTGDANVRVEPLRPGYLVDWTEDGRPIGIEMPSPSLVTVEGLNRVLSELHLDPVPPEEAAPDRCRLTLLEGFPPHADQPGPVRPQHL